jgi:hypothetical protein
MGTPTTCNDEERGVCAGQISDPRIVFVGRVWVVTAAG